MVTVALTSESEMALAAAQPLDEPGQGDQRVVFRGIGWTGYEALLRIQAEKSRPQLLYLDGNVLLMSPSHIHGRLDDRLGMFVRLVVEELEIPCIPTPETTFHRQDLQAGVQPDDSFYLANLGPIAAKDGMENIDLNIDPPPDLVIEVVHAHSAKFALEVLRRIGVPEVWVGKPTGLQILLLSEEGHYVESDNSKSFPYLSAAEIFAWVSKPDRPIMTQWIKELRRWVQDVLVARVRGQDG
jgi:Uma2 family endonuclease